MIFSLLIFFYGYIYNHKDWQHFPGLDTVYTITSSKKEVFVAGRDVIIIFDRQAVKFLKTLTTLDGIPDNIRFIGYDEEFSALWIVDHQSFLTRYHPFTRVKRRYTLSIKPTAMGVAKNYLYFLSGKEQYQWDKKKEQLKKIKQVPDKDVVWYGSKKSFQVRDYTFLTPYYLIDENLVVRPYNEVFLAGKNLWVGCIDYGVLVYDVGLKKEIKRFRLSGSLNKIKKILSLQNRVWLLSDRTFIETSPDFGNWRYFDIHHLGIYPKELFLFNRKFLDLFRFGDVVSIAGDDQSLVFSSKDKVYFFSNETAQSIVLDELPAQPKTIHLLLLEKDTLLILTSDMLYFYSLKEQMFLKMSPAHPDLKFGVYSIAKSKTGYHFGIRGGFLTLSEQGWEKVILPGADLSFPTDQIAVFLNNLFLKTKDGLLIYELDKKRQTLLTTKEGLLGNRIYALYCDGNHLWIATNNGVSKFNFKTLLKN